MVIPQIFSSAERYAGRRVFGARHPSWSALEDKLLIDALWDEAGLRRAPSEEIPLEEDALRAAIDRLDRGAGVVLAGDNKSGWHGGASGTRWVRDEESFKRELSGLKPLSQLARVMPYLEGIPCSIHGWVFDDTVISLRPCEMLITERSVVSEFNYLGAATSWRAAPALAEEMSAFVERAGAHLRERFAYRGVFTVDGVATRDGFLPTELNPRFGGALGRLNGACPDLPLYFLHLCTIEGRLSDPRPELLRETILAAAELKPIARASYVLKGVDIKEERRASLRWGDQGWEVTAPSAHQRGESTLLLGPATAGAMLFATLSERDLDGGAPALPRLLELCHAATERWPDLTLDL